MMLSMPTGQPTFTPARGWRERLSKWHRENFLAQCDRCLETIAGIRGHEQTVAKNTGWLIKENGDALCPFHRFKGGQ